MTSFDELVRASAPHRLQSKVLEDATRVAVNRSTTRALQQYAAHVAAVVRNNAGKSAAEVLARRDVVEELARARVTLLDSLGSQLRGAYTAASQLGITHGEELLRTLGVTPQTVSAPRTSPYIDSVVADMVRNVNTAMTRVGTDITAAWAQDLPESAYNDPQGSTNPRASQARARGRAVTAAVERVSRDLSLRTQLGAGVAVTRAREDAQRAVYEAAQTEHKIVIRMVWVCEFVNNTPCEQHCRPLHGTVRPLGAEFPRPRGLRVYLDLVAPPCHPNCHCRLVPYVENLTDRGTLTAAQLVGSRPVTQPKSMTSQEVRDLPEDKFRSTLALFEAVVRRLIGKRKRKRA